MRRRAESVLEISVFPSGISVSGQRGMNSDRPRCIFVLCLLYFPHIISISFNCSDSAIRVWRQIGDKIDTQISWPWKHFFASKIVLRVIVCCLRVVGSMSSSRRRIPRFIVLFSSWHRYGLMSSLRHFYVFVSSGLPLDCATYLGRYLMYGDIHCTDFTCISWPSLFCLVHSLCYPVTLLLCYLVTLLPYCSVPLLLCCHFLNFSLFLHDKSQS